MNAIQIKIDNNVRMLAELHARWEREAEIDRKNSIARVCTITTTSNAKASHVDPNNVPLASLVAQEEHVDVNFIKK